MAAETGTVWALGDYHRFSTEQMRGAGAALVAAAGIGPGLRVLDVAAGTGTVAIQAAEAGATVVASDLEPAHFDAGRREARARGVEVEWIAADAQELPFGDGEFDVVTSAFGVMFAPDHERAAAELVRVCRPGGTIALASFTPEGLGGAFFGLFAPYLPAPPPGALPPLLWGSEEHVRELLAARTTALDLRRETYVEHAATPLAYRELFKATFGPVIAAYAALADAPGRRDALDREFLDFATSANQGRAGGPAEYPYEYLRVLARTA